MSRPTGLSALVLAAVLVGCGSTSDSSAGGGTPAPPGHFADIYAELFPLGTHAQCNYCHDRPPNDISDGNLAMGHTTADAYAALVGPTSSSSKCGGKPLVVAGDPEGSLLYQKLGAAPPCGDRMPQGADPLTADQLEQVRSWIAAGAPND